jgi:NRPS condensation-like uncharacterized protein
MACPREWAARSPEGNFRSLLGRDDEKRHSLLEMVSACAGRARLGLVGIGRVSRDVLDPLQRLYLALEDTANVNTNQIVVIGGHLDVPRLREAIRQAVRPLELCTSGVSGDGSQLRRGFWAPEDVPFESQVYPGQISFQVGALRRTLMDLSRANPLRWRRRPPLQVFYLTDVTGLRSALMTSCHHAIVDARAQELLLERLIETYAALGGEKAADGGARPVGAFRYVPYAEIVRELAARREGRLEAGGTFRGMTRALLRRSWSSFWAPPPGDGAIDFLHHELDDDTDGLIRGISRASGETINTVLTAALYRVAGRSRSRPGAVQIGCPVSLRSLDGGQHRDNFQNLAVPCWLTLKRGYANDADLMAAIAGQVTALRQGKVLAVVDRLESWLRIPAPLRRRLAGLTRGRAPIYSNPGTVGAGLDSFGDGGPPVLQYVNFGALNPPHDYILYTPQFRDRLYLNVIYRAAAFSDVEAELLRPMRNAIGAMAEAFSVTR